MAKVIVERPRLGGGARRPKGNRKRERLSLEDKLPSREGYRQRWTSWSKNFNEHLAPLRRYLQSQVGRPWNKVHSEICKHLRPDSTVQRHVLEHLWDYVETNARLVGGVLCDAKGQPLAYSWRRSLYYVCPKSGLLRALPRIARHRQREAPPSHIPVSDNRQWHCLNDIWYEVELAPRDGAPPQARDALLKIAVQKLSRGELGALYGSECYAVTKRQLGKREVRLAKQRLGSGG